MVTAHDPEPGDPSRSTAALAKLILGKPVGYRRVSDRFLQDQLRPVDLASVALAAGPPDWGGGGGGVGTLTRVVLQTSPERPAPVRVISQAIGAWVDRLGPVWVEGQVAQLTQRPGTSTVFLTLRDTAAAMSLQLTCSRQVLLAVQPPLMDGARVVVYAKPSWYPLKGTLSLTVAEIRPVGEGALLARLEHTKRLLAAEGLFNADRKRPLPFLPAVVGLVCGRGSAAEHDVLENAKRRWPAVQFRVINVAVQGATAAPQVMHAIRTLDADRDVEVIIVARGGGSVEDLLPFSEENLLRTVSAARTPIVSAIGHESDTPLLDLVADVRASTPSDAAKRVVPDVAEEYARIRQARDQLNRALNDRLGREQYGLDALRSRPAMADPTRLVVQRTEEISALLNRVRQCVTHCLEREAVHLEHTRARVLALSPAATLRRGYAVVQRADDGHVVRAPTDAPRGANLRLRLAAGELAATAGDPL
jgi:exodeoxyribonuclease VII large subunit